MDYVELIEKALGGRSARRAAQMWDIPASTLDRYMRGERMPDFKTTVKIIEDSGIPAEEAVRIIAAQEQLRKDGGPPVSRTRHQRIMSPLL